MTQQQLDEKTEDSEGQTPVKIAAGKPGLSCGAPEAGAPEARCGQPGVVCGARSRPKKAS
jgi:hypothetical protein